MIIDVIAGARPNFMKVAALFAVENQFAALNLRLVHTGQHYDTNMSDIFLQELNLPEPVCHLGVGSGSHAAQTAAIMTGYEDWIKTNRPDMCLVVGDVNSTIACALVAAKEGILISHVEAGLRSFDRNMPEEINRVLTDSISDYMFVTEQTGVANLANEGRPLVGIHLVGHVMIDTLFRMIKKTEHLKPFEQFGARAGEYVYLTLHRPSNVDFPDTLAAIMGQIARVAEQLPVIFPIHPRTMARLESSGLVTQLRQISSLHFTDPVGYLESLALIKNAKVIITDSGGLQEESSALGVPCLTLRQNTERPITIQEGTNTLIGHNWKLFNQCIDQIQAGTYRQLVTPIPYWDGHAAERILRIIHETSPY